MPDADPKHPLWNPLRTNAQRIKELLAECVRLGEELSDQELNKWIRNAVDFNDRLQERIDPRTAKAKVPRSSTKELLNRLRAEYGRVRELVDASEGIATELGDSESKKLIFWAQNMGNQLEMRIETMLRARS